MDDFTSGDIAQGVDTPAAVASPALHPDPADSTAPAPIAPDAGADEHGPVPFERHEAILGKTRRDYDEKLSRLSWAERHDPEKVQRALALADRYDRDPDTLYRELDARVHPSTKPQPDLRTEDGHLMYSAEQADRLAEWQAQKLVASEMRKLEDRIGPIESERQETKEVEKFTGQINAAMEWPGFRDHLSAITEAVSRGLTLHEAYITVVTPVLSASRDSLRAEERKAILAEMATAGRAVKDELNPGRVPAASHKPDKDKSMSEILDEEMTKRR